MVQTQKVLGNRAELERRLAAFEKQPDMPKELLDKGIRYAQDALAAIPKDTKPSTPPSPCSNCWISASISASSKRKNLSRRRRASLFVLGMVLLWS